MSEVITVKLSTTLRPGKYSEERIRQAMVLLLDDRRRVVMNNIRASMATTKHGKTYTRNGHTWTASAPGEAPAIGPTGKLKGSLRARKSNGGLRIRITAEIGYGRLLEEGKGRLKARPFMKPAVEGLRPLLVRDAREAIDRGILNRA